MAEYMTVDVSTVTLIQVIIGSLESVASMASCRRGHHQIFSLKNPMKLVCGEACERETPDHSINLILTYLTNLIPSSVNRFIFHFKSNRQFKKTP